MKQVTRKIGRNRGKPRLWIEGPALIRAGLDHGNRWDLIPAPSGFDIVRNNPAGKRKIAGRPGRPIIDISGPRSLGAVADVEVVTLNISDGKIEVRR
ncbi:hypothetical protein [Primorskyibacter sp. S87]|uniref:hypothetical protein n=1 Tax=Primorskyibacter sp. S87 TaxID=3415126 RepID=UPI003C7A3236